jgi:2-C-methyl-D-erythritol 4-phosphate cytidylyltransferase/2-C-methyl-D-erythritol 2,4-cyclodiphosphate synthase
LSDITLIVLSAGNSSRFEIKAKKQWLRCGDEPLWLYVTNNFSKLNLFDKIIVTSNTEELNYMKNFSNEYMIIEGGNTRQESIRNALQKVTSKYVMITDVARACVPKQLILDIVKNKDNAECIVPFLSVSDTVLYNNQTINRDEVKLIQTPQLSEVEKLRQALSQGIEFTDESSALKSMGAEILYLKGDKKASKLTFGAELNDIDCLKSPSRDNFVGTGIDIHPFEENKPMVLGGVEIECAFGFKAHSDGDVLIHSVIDSILGAMGAGDIGEFFPDTETIYKDADSKELLKYIVQFAANVGYEIINVDVTIIAQIPKINPYKNTIKTSLSTLLQIPKYKINIKATTAEKLGFIGREEAIAVQSCATLKFYDWKKQ